MKQERILFVQKIVALVVAAVLLSLPAAALLGSNQEDPSPQLTPQQLEQWQKDLSQFEFEFAQLDKHTLPQGTQ